MSYIRTFSPYHNVVENKKYPNVLFTTSTRDDRVHPGHARKMMAKMEAQKHSVWYYENIEGGHGGAANNKQSAFMQTLGRICSYASNCSRTSSPPTEKRPPPICRCPIRDRRILGSPRPCSHSGIYFSNTMHTDALSRIPPTPKGVLKRAFGTYVVSFPRTPSARTL